jgi:hypothetical protein
MSKNSTLPTIIRLVVLVSLIHCLIGLTGCTTITTPIIKMVKPTPDIIKQYKSVVVWARNPGMFDTGVEMKRGDYITILAEGEINIRPGQEGQDFIKEPYGGLLYRVGKDNLVVRYFGDELISIEKEGPLYLGYVGSPIDKYGEPKTPSDYRDDIGNFVVDIIVWAENNPILMTKFFEEASLRDPNKASLKEMLLNFEKRKDLFMAEQEANEELAEAEKAITDLEIEDFSKQKATGEKAEDTGPTVIAAKGKGPLAVQEPEKKVTTTSQKPQEEIKTTLPQQEKEIPGTRDDEKEKIIAELNERLQKAMQALHDLEEMKRQMAAQLVEQQKRETEITTRLEALDRDRVKQSKNIPLIAIATPKDGIMVDSEYISLAGVAEHEKGIEKFEIFLNGQQAHFNNQRGVKRVQVEQKRIEFSERIHLREGKNDITILAQDKEGITAEKTIFVHMAKKRGEIWVVIIGINQYSDFPSLKYAVNDAKEFYRYMTEVNDVPKDHIWLLLDGEATLDRIRSILGTQLRRKAGKEDMVIIYLAGHGATEKDPSSPDGDGLEKYILPHNANSKDLYATAIPMGEVSRIFQRISSEKLVFLTDTCYSGASGGRTILASGVRANVSGAFWDRLSQGKGRMIIAASDANQVSAEKDELKHGVFTYYLLEGLSGKADFDGNGIITLDEIYRYVSIKVPQATGQDQHPVKKGEMTGEIILGIVKKP